MSSIINLTFIEDKNYLKTNGGSGGGLRLKCDDFVAERPYCKRC